MAPRREPSLSGAFLLLPSLVVLQFSLPEPLQGKTWTVSQLGDSDSGTIQGAMMVASSGDTILVAPGTYSESIDFLGKAVLLKSSQGPTVTTIDGSGHNESGLVNISSTDGGVAVINGFTISSGIVGVRVIDAAPIIANNIIVNNSTGIALNVSRLSNGPYDPKVIGNTIMDNQSDLIGGGLVAWGPFAVSITDNVFENNVALNGDGGGVFLLLLSSGSVLVGNRFLGNHAGDHGGAIHIAALGSSAIGVEVAHNLFLANSASGTGGTPTTGGAIRSSGSNSWIHHNTFVWNQDNRPERPSGGTIALDINGSSTIEQNIIANTEGGFAIYCVEPGNSVIRNNVFWSNKPNNAGGSCNVASGNVTEDPLFCLASEEYAVASNSPAMYMTGGPAGWLLDPGCGPAGVNLISWGQLKRLYSPR